MGNKALTKLLLGVGVLNVASLHLLVVVVDDVGLSVHVGGHLD